jgi:hypothetical protein
MDRHPKIDLLDALAQRSFLVALPLQASTDMSLFLHRANFHCHVRII